MDGRVLLLLHDRVYILYWSTKALSMLLRNWPFTDILSPSLLHKKKFIDDARVAWREGKNIITDMYRGMVEEKMRSEAHTDYNYNNLKFSADVTVHRGCCRKNTARNTQVERVSERWSGGGRCKWNKKMHLRLRYFFFPSSFAIFRCVKGKFIGIKLVGILKHKNFLIFFVSF